MVGYLTEEGKTVIKADHYDSVRDMFVDGKNVEVKTQVAYITENAVSIRKDQFKKCMKAHRVYFICVPHVKDVDYSGYILEMDPKKVEMKDLFAYEKDEPKEPGGKRDMIGFRRYAEAFSVYGVIEDKSVLDVLVKYNSSEW